MKGLKLKQILEDKFPLALQEEWDNSGLQVGTLNKEINSILIALDVTQEIINEAIDKKVDMIITHHPLLFMPIKSLEIDVHIGKYVHQLITHNITLYAIHTNYDSIAESMSKQLGNLLHLKQMSPLIMVTETNGYGVKGSIPKTPIKKYIENVKETFGVKNARFIGDLTSTVSKVALLGGSGKDDMKQVSKMNVDLYITGDITYHFAVDAHALGLNVLDIGHFIEHKGLIGIKEMIEKEVSIPVMISNCMKDPYIEV